MVKDRFIDYDAGTIIPPMRSRVFPILFGLLFGVTYLSEGLLYRDYNEDEFQVATAYLKDRNPSLYNSDFVWTDPEMIRNLHVCVRGLMRITHWATPGMFQEPIDIYLLWLPVCVFAFFLGIYLLCLRFTRTPLASLLVACSFMLVRRVVGDWWGIGPTFTMSARGLVMSFMPLLLWLFFECRGQLIPLAWTFFCWGVLSNLHPLGGWGLVEFLGITMLLADRFRWRTWKQVFVMGGTTLLGSAPFLFVWLGVSYIPPDQRADPELVRQFWNTFGGLGRPNPLYIRHLLKDIALPLGISLIGLICWWRSRKTQDRLEMRILQIFPVVVLATTAAVLIIGYNLKQMGFSLPIMVPEHLRNNKMIYLTLPVWMALAFTHWFEWRHRSPPLIRLSLPLLAILGCMIINFPGHKLARHLAFKAGFLPESAAQKLEREMADSDADLEVALWAREHTDPAALFYFDSYEFRYYAQRSLVFCWFDLPCVGFRPTKTLEEWIHRRDLIMPLKRARDTDGMWKVAQSYHADYLVIQNDWPKLATPAVWSNSKYSIYAVPNNVLEKEDL